MSRWQQQGRQSTDHDGGARARASASRRRVLGAGMAGAAVSAGSGTPARLGAAPSRRRQEATDEGIRGGRLRVATTGQPAGLDMHFVNQRTITLIGWNMFEALFTFDAEYATVPMLAQAIETAPTD